MKSWIIAIAAAACAALLLVPEADAARIGGGRSIGAQRSIARTPPPAALPARPAAQSQPAAPPGAQPQPAGALGRWAPLLGGLAIGGLLGALFGASGLASLLTGWLMVAAVLFALAALWRLLAQRRAASPGPMSYAAGVGGGAYASLGNETVVAPPPSQAAGFESPPPAMPAAGIPEGFDVAGFLRAAKLNFMKLQAANDAGRLDTLRELTTTDLYDELRRELSGRGPGGQQTDIVSLEADLLEVVTEGDQHWASVRFSGRVRERSDAATEGFEEVWNLCKPVNGSSGWLLAGVQQMH